MVKNTGRLSGDAHLGQYDRFFKKSNATCLFLSASNTRRCFKRLTYSQNCAVMQTSDAAKMSGKIALFIILIIVFYAVAFYDYSVVCFVMCFVCFYVYVVAFHV